MPRVDEDFRQRMAGYGLLTAEIHYWMPDHPSILQQFVWQKMDIAPHFPELARFLEHWRREIEATLHSIRVAHSAMLRPAEIRQIDQEFRLH